MTYAIEAKEIEEHFETEYDETAIRWQNAPWKPADDVDEWIEFFVLSADSQAIGIGNDDTQRYRHVGLVQGDIYVPENTGTRRLREIADAFFSVFRGELVGSGGNIEFMAPQPNNAGSSPVSGYVRLIVRVPFQRDELF